MCAVTTVITVIKDIFNKLMDSEEANELGAREADTSMDTLTVLK